MAERISDETQELESTTVGIYRTAAVVKGGRRFSFSALVVVGDRRGRVGLGYGKAPGVPAAIEKAQKAARRALCKIVLQSGTLPHSVTAKFGASLVKLIPAAPGTGVIAGATVRAVLEMAGVQDCLTKSFGSNNQKNLAKAALDGLKSLRTKADIATIRGVEIDDTDVEQLLATGARFATTTKAESDIAKGPVNTVGQKNSKGGKGGRGRGGGGRGRGGGGGGGGGARAGGAAAPSAGATTATAPAAAAPAKSTPAQAETPPAAETKPPSSD